MKNIAAIALAALLINGCTPKMGEDIRIEPQGNLRWENSGSEVMLGIFSLLGASVEKEEIRIGTDLKVLNKWHSDIKVVSLTYTLSEDQEPLADGEAKRSTTNPIVIASGEEKIIPLILRVDPKRLRMNRLLSLIQSKRRLVIKGDAVIEVWGIQKHYPFEKEATKLVQKALKGGA
jgi:LEA14-like dessication related protein